MNNELPRFTNEHLANERTFLAWVRTAIAIMAFGFVVVKFSIFIRQISFAFTEKVLPQTGKGYSPYIGIFLVAMGAAILLLSYLQYKRTQTQIDKMSFKKNSTLTLLLTILIFSGSIGLIIYLFSSI